MQYVITTYSAAETLAFGHVTTDAGSQYGLDSPAVLATVTGHFTGGGLPVPPGKTIPDTTGMVIVLDAGEGLRAVALVNSLPNLAALGTPISLTSAN